MLNSDLPCVDFRSSAASRIEGQLFLNIIASMEAEAVPLAVGGTLQLL